LSDKSDAAYFSITEACHREVSGNRLCMSDFTTDLRSPAV